MAYLVIKTVNMQKKMSIERRKKKIQVKYKGNPIRITVGFSVEI